MNQFYRMLEEILSSVSSDPRRELALMAEYAVGIPSDRFLLLCLTDGLPCLTAQQADRLHDLVRRRGEGEPLQYLLGSADFYGRSFSVRPGVLIPRFDTEILVDTALPRLQEGDSVLDLCAGSGCIGLTLGAEKNLRVTCVEKYPEAFALLRENTAKIYPSARLVQGDVLTDAVEGTFDMIVSNPPYIPTGDLPSLSVEVQREPSTALDGGEDGLYFYRVLADRFVSSLKEDGWMLFECGIGQASAIEKILLSAGLCDPVCVRDYGGIPRVVGARKPREVSYV
jgi:release factor glutamine methyltransferase